MYINCYAFLPIIWNILSSRWTIYVLNAIDYFAFIHRDYKYMYIQKNIKSVLSLHVYGVSS